LKVCRVIEGIESQLSVVARRQQKSNGAQRGAGRNRRSDRIRFSKSPADIVEELGLTRRVARHFHLEYK